MQKLIVSDKTGKSYSIEVEEKNASKLVGVGIGKVVDATPFGLHGYKIQITGGSDKEGVPMRFDVHGTAKPKILLSKGPGYRPKEFGLKRRKRVCGSAITRDMVQINAKVSEKGPKGLEELFGAAKPEAKPKEKNGEV